MTSGSDSSAWDEPNRDVLLRRRRGAIASGVRCLDDAGGEDVSDKRLALSTNALAEFAYAELIQGILDRGEHSDGWGPAAG